MAKMMCFILGLALLALGILGITGAVPVFTSDTNYANIVEIILGGLNLFVGIFTRKSTEYDRQQNDFSRQKKDSYIW